MTTDTAVEPQSITVPGQYDMPFDVYLADPVPGGSLSASGAKRLLPPGCPAKFRHWRDHPKPVKREFDIGHAAHTLVLGEGPELVDVGAQEWRSNAVKAEVEAIRAEGKVPLRPSDFADVHGMAAALRADPIAGALFEPGTGKAEQSLFWRDGHSGVNCRARLDWLGDATAERRLIVGDYKTTEDGSPVSIPRYVENFGYAQQADWYLEAVRALGLSPAPVFLLIFQEREAPYLVTPVELSARALAIGAIRNRHARETYARCVADDHWPGHTEDIELVGLPPWIEAQYESEFRR